MPWQSEHDSDPPAALAPIKRSASIASSESESSGSGFITPEPAHETTASIRPTLRYIERIDSGRVMSTDTALERDARTTSWRSASRR